MARKIVHLSSVHPAVDNRILNKQCRSLARAGYEVVLIAPHDQEEIFFDVQIRPLPTWSNRFARVSFGLAKVLSQALSENGDVYHIHDPELLFIASLLRRCRNVPVIYDMHENVPKSLATKSWLPVPFRFGASWMWRYIEKLILKNMPVIFAERSYKKAYNWLDHSVVVENMVLPTLTTLKRKKQEHFTIVYVGGISRSRGIDIIMSALTSLWEMDEEIQFECVGPVYQHALRLELETFKKDWGCRVRFHGRLPQHDAMAIAARAHAGLAVLKPLPNYIESYPTKLFEYMALGIPVITSNFPMYREVVETEGVGMCIPPENVQALTGAILRLKQNPEEAEIMGKRGRDAVLDRYNWERQKQKLLSFYELVLGSS